MTVNECYKIMEKIEAGETIVNIRTSSFPTMKKHSRESYYNNLEKKAVIVDNRKALSTKELAKKLSGMDINGQ